MKHTAEEFKVRKNSSRNRWISISFASVLLGAVVLFLATAEDTVDVNLTENRPSAQLVSIETIPVSAETIEITTFAEVRPRWSVELKAAVSGRVIKVLDTALAGEQVTAGTTLITIENSPYVSELAAADLALKEAALSLWTAQNATLLARKDYERANRPPPNDLALKLPQLEIAKSAVAAAKARVTTAKRQLNDSTIVAPFSGFITDRYVSPGQTVSVGDRLVKLVDNRVFELIVELSREDWLMLRQPLAGQIAKVANESGRTVAEAIIRQGGGFLDEATRQYKLFLEIRNGEAQHVLSGDFVRVKLQGITVPDALSIPASALTQEGFAWHVDQSDHIQRFTPKVLFRRHDRIVVEAPKGTETWQIVTAPLSSFLPGQKVKAQTSEN